MRPYGCRASPETQRFSSCERWRCGRRHALGLLNMRIRRAAREGKPVRTHVLLFVDLLYDGHPTLKGHHERGCTVKRCVDYAQSRPISSIRSTTSRPPDHEVWNPQLISTNCAACQPSLSSTWGSPRHVEGLGHQSAFALMAENYGQ
jgi:hypothetical protein